MSTVMKVKTIVLPGHRVEITAPELPEGADVDVSVELVSEERVATLSDRFRQLAERWRRETAPLSSVSQMAIHPAYQAIIGMGWDVVPFILRDLQNAPDHWFWALRAITGEDPVQEDQRGNVQQMATAWIQWGRDHGYVS